MFILFHVWKIQYDYSCVILVWVIHLLWLEVTWGCIFMFATNGSNSFSTMHDPYLSHTSMMRPNFRTQNRSVNGKNTIEIKTSLDFRDLLQKKTLNERIVGYLIWQWQLRDERDYLYRWVSIKISDCSRYVYRTFVAPWICNLKWPQRNWHCPCHKPEYTLIERLVSIIIMHMGHMFWLAVDCRQE